MLSSSLCKTKKNTKHFNFLCCSPSWEKTVGCNFPAVALDAGKGWNYAIICCMCCSKWFFVGLVKWLYSSITFRIYCCCCLILTFFFTSFIYLILFIWKIWEHCLNSIIQWQWTHTFLFQVNPSERFSSASKAAAPKDDWMLLLPLNRPVCYLLDILAAYQS